MATGGVAAPPKPAGKPPARKAGGKPKTVAPNGPEGGTAVVETGTASPAANATEKKTPSPQQEGLSNEMAGAASTDDALKIAASQAKDKPSPSTSEAGHGEAKIFDDPKEDPAIQAIEQSITTQINSDSEVQNALQSGDATYTAEWQRAHTRIGNRKWDSWVAAQPDKASTYAEKHPQIKAALERQAQAEEAAAAAGQTGESPQAEQAQATAEETTNEASAEAASQGQETNATDNELRAAQKRTLVLTKSKSEALKQLRTWIRMEVADAGQTLTPEQEIQQAHDQFVAEQTDIAIGRLRQGDSIEQIVAGGESLFQEQQRKVRSAMEAEGRTQDEAFEGEVTRRSLHAYFQERDRITTEMMEGDKYKDERYAAEQIKQGVSRVVEQAKLAGKTEISNNEALEQAQREFANLRAESLQARPDGIPADAQENPYFQKAMKEVHARRKDLAERNNIEMNAAWYTDVQKEALTEAYLEELKEKKTLLQMLLEAFKQATISFGIVGVDMLKGQFEETATGK